MITILVDTHEEKKQILELSSYLKNFELQITGLGSNSPEIYASHNDYGKKLITSDGCYGLDDDIFPALKYIVGLIDTDESIIVASEVIDQIEQNM